MIVIKSEPLRRVLKFLVIALSVATVIIGGFVVSQKNYIYIAFVLTVLALILFITGFDKRKIGSRRMVITAIMIVLCVVGRFIPFFKPITAITVLSAMYLGSEAGFFVGALSAFISNFYFGQGPWTPFQMLAWGIIGFIAGIVNCSLKKSKVMLYAFGVLSGIAFSMIMDVWTVLWYSGGFNIKLYLAAIVSAAPVTLVYCVSNVIFLMLFAKPFGQKLERIKIKYGI